MFSKLNQLVFQAAYVRNAITIKLRIDIESLSIMPKFYNVCKRIIF